MQTRWLIGKDPDAGKDWRQKEKRASEDEIAGWHHQLNGHEFGQVPGDNEGQGGLACCSPWDHKESETTGRLKNWVTGFTLWLSSKESACHARAKGDVGSITGSGRSPGGGQGNPLQCSCWENPRNRGAWRAPVHRFARSQTQLKGLACTVDDFNSSFSNKSKGLLVSDLGKIIPLLVPTMPQVRAPYNK